MTRSKQALCPRDVDEFNNANKGNVSNNGSSNNNNSGNRSFYTACPEYQYQPLYYCDNLHGDNLPEYRGGSQATPGLYAENKTANKQLHHQQHYTQHHQHQHHHQIYHQQPHQKQQNQQEYWKEEEEDMHLSLLSRDDALSLPGEPFVCTLEEDCGCSNCLQRLHWDTYDEHLWPVDLDEHHDFLQMDDLLEPPVYCSAGATPLIGERLKDSYLGMEAEKENERNWRDLCCTLPPRQELQLYPHQQPNIFGSHGNNDSIDDDLAFLDELLLGNEPSLAALITDLEEDRHEQEKDDRLCASQRVVQLASPISNGCQPGRVDGLELDNKNDEDVFYPVDRRREEEASLDSAVGESCHSLDLSALPFTPLTSTAPLAAEIISIPQPGHGNLESTQHQRQRCFSTASTWLQLASPSLSWQHQTLPTPGYLLAAVPPPNKVARRHASSSCSLTPADTAPLAPPPHHNQHLQQREKQHKSNLASKRSREKRKIKYSQMERRSQMLAELNENLLRFNLRLKRLLQECRDLINSSLVQQQQLRRITATDQTTAAVMDKTLPI